MVLCLRSCRHGLFSTSRRCFSSVRTHIEDKRWPGWQIIIGIEVHAQIKSRRKLFSETTVPVAGNIPNTCVSPFDAAFPGTLPRLNMKCVALATRVALALKSHIKSRSTFDRKHYFYPDLPAGYQITQHYAPFAVGGHLVLPNDTAVPVRIKQIQLEQDTAKSIFDPRRRETLIDLNRAGMGLMEIVSEPDMRSPEEAALYVRSLQSLLRAVGASDGNMEQGSLRCDVNISVNRPGLPPGTRCEIKNLNSVKFMMSALSSEIRRHIDILESTLSVPQETRGFSEQTFETFKLRSKEDAPDYRYMPDMNLGTLHITEAQIQNIRETMPELPDATRSRLQKQYSLHPRDVEILLALDAEKDIPFDGETGGPSSAGAVRYFENICQDHGQGVKEKPRDPKVVLNWIIHELVGQLSARHETFTAQRVPSSWLAELIDMVHDNIITRTSGKSLLRHILHNPSEESPKKLAHRLDLIALRTDDQVSSAGTAPLPGDMDLAAICQTTISQMPAEVVAYRAGNDNVLNKLVGHVMKTTRGRANALAVKTTLLAMLDGS